MKILGMGIPELLILLLIGGAIAAVLVVVLNSKSSKSNTAAFQQMNVPAGMPPLQNGNPQPNAGFCASCGAPLNPGSKFCMACGKPIAAANDPQDNE